MSCPSSRMIKPKSRNRFEVCLKVCLKWQSWSGAKGRQGCSFPVPQRDALPRTRTSKKQQEEERAGVAGRFRSPRTHHLSDSPRSVAPRLFGGLTQASLSGTPNTPSIPPQLLH